MRKRRLFIVGIYILTLVLILGCSSSQASIESDCQSANVPVEIINKPPYVEIDIENNTINTSIVTDNKRYRKLSLSFNVKIYNRSDKYISSIKYSVRGYSKSNKLFDTDETYLASDKLDSLMSKDAKELQFIENYSESLPDKIILEITNYTMH